MPQWVEIKSILGEVFFSLWLLYQKSNIFILHCFHQLGLYGRRTGEWGWKLGHWLHYHENFLDTWVNCQDNILSPTYILSMLYGVIVDLAIAWEGELLGLVYEENLLPFS